jgi:hypothetical protein
LPPSENLNGFIDNLKSMLWTHANKGRVDGVAPEFVLNSTSYLNTVFVALEGDDGEDLSGPAVASTSSFMSEILNSEQRQGKKNLYISTDTDDKLVVPRNSKRDSRTGLSVAVSTKHLRFLESCRFRTLAYLCSSEAVSACSSVLNELKGLHTVLRSVEKTLVKHGITTKHLETASSVPLLCVICDPGVQRLLEVSLRALEIKTQLLEIVFCCPLGDSNDTVSNTSAPSSAISDNSQLAPVLSPGSVTSRADSDRTAQSLVGLTIAFPDDELDGRFFAKYSLDDVVRYDTFNLDQRECLYEECLPRMKTVVDRNGKDKTESRLCADVKAALLTPEDEIRVKDRSVPISTTGAHSLALNPFAQIVDVGTFGGIPRPETHHRGVAHSNTGYMDVSMSGIGAVENKGRSPNRSASPVFYPMAMPPLVPTGPKSAATVTSGRVTPLMAPPPPSNAPAFQMVGSPQPPMSSRSAGRIKQMGSGQVEASIDLTCAAVATHFRNLMTWADRSETDEGSAGSNNFHTTRAGSSASTRDSASTRVFVNQTPSGVVFVRTVGILVGETLCTRAEVEASDCCVTLTIDTQAKVFTLTVAGMSGDLVDRRFK